MSFLWTNFVEYYEEDIQCIKAKWIRMKTKFTENLSIMPSPNGFEGCAIHALATHAALLDSPSDNAFPTLS